MKKFKSLACFVICLVILLQTLFLSFTASAASNDVLGIDNGKVYNIRNVRTGMYLTVEGGVNAQGQNVKVGPQNKVLAQQRWKVIRQSDGTYRLQSMLSGTVRYLDRNGSNIDIWTDYLSDQKFSLSRVSGSSYGGTYQITIGSQYVHVNSSNDVVLTSSLPNQDSHLWSFELAEKGAAEYFSYKFNGYDSTGASADVCSKMTSMGYFAYNLQQQSASVAHFYMTFADIWVFRGHGTTGGSVLSFYKQNTNGDSVHNGYITANSGIGLSNSYNIDSLGTNELANARCVLYIACRTGMTRYVGANTVNLVDSTYNKGAHFVLGIKTDTVSGANDKWVKAFFTQAAAGSPATKLINYIDYANNQQDFRSILHYVGDVHQSLK